ncbi:MAG: hypothetical protein GWO08_03390, partial [Gammaproteobacteria bacterium]|nr:hypothetical protein [Gammaproteobacteria bacterium]
DLVFREDRIPEKDLNILKVIKGFFEKIFNIVDLHRSENGPSDFIDKKPRRDND